MLGSLRRSSFLALAAVALLGAGSIPAVMAQPALVSTAPQEMKKAARRGDSGMRPSAAAYGRKGVGISVAQGKRNARKARNVARNRAAHR